MARWDDREERIAKRKESYVKTQLNNALDGKKDKHRPTSPVIGKNGLNITPGDNAHFIQVGLELFNLPDVDLTNAKAVQERLSWYFAFMAENEMKPTVAGMGLALNGMDRRELWEIKSGQFRSSSKLGELPLEVRENIKKAYKFMENLHEGYMNSGKINPVSGIFLAKNNFDYVDKTEHVVTPNTNTDDIVDLNEIKKRYLPEGIEVDGTEIE